MDERVCKLSPLEKDTLLVGLDNSNHAGERIGEVIVATFSFNLRDLKIKNYGPGRNYDRFNFWMKEKPNPPDFRFGVLIAEKYRHNQQNIPIAAPELIEGFLGSLDFMPLNLSLHIDGGVNPQDRNFLKTHFQNQFKKVSINYYIKQRNVHLCPMPVYAAHILAHDLYSSGFSELTEHPKFVVLKCA